MLWVLLAGLLSLSANGQLLTGIGLDSGTAAVSNCTPAAGFSNCRAVSFSSVVSNRPSLFCGNSVSTQCSSNTDFLKNTGSGGKTQNSSCFDVVWTSDLGGTTQIAFEAVPIVSGKNCNVTTGAVQMYVLAASSPAYISYGNVSQTTDPSNKTGTWPAAYKARWHWADGTTLGLGDSTSGAHTLTNANSTATTGNIDGGAAFNGTNARLSVAAALFDFTTTGATVSCWLNATSDPTSNVWSAVTGSSNRDGMETQSATGTLRAGHFNGTTTVGISGNISTGTWYHAVYTLSTGGTTAHLYINGVDQVGTNTGSNNSNAGFAIGARTGTAANFFPGTVDEMGVLNFDVDQAWVTAEYNNASSPSTFITIGTEH